MSQIRTREDVALEMIDIIKKDIDVKLNALSKLNDNRTISSSTQYKSMKLKIIDEFDTLIDELSSLQKELTTWTVKYHNLTCRENDRWMS